MSFRSAELSKFAYTPELEGFVEYPTAQGAVDFPFGLTTSALELSGDFQCSNLTVLNSAVINANISASNGTLIIKNITNSEIINTANLTAVDMTASGNVGIAGDLSSATLTVSGNTVASGSLSVHGVNNNSAGIANCGSIAGATTITTNALTTNSLSIPNNGGAGSFNCQANEALAVFEYGFTINGTPQVQAFVPTRPVAGAYSTAGSGFTITVNSNGLISTIVANP